MEDLMQLRKRIDEVDDQILCALNARVQICKAIGEAKQEQGLPIKDEHRENEVYKRVTQKARNLRLDPAKIEAIFREIVNMCNTVQIQKTPE